MGRRGTSRADRQVIEAASAQGVTVTARQLERWRQQGAIPRADRRGLGRGRGSASVYTAEDIGYIVEFARLAGPKRRPTQITIWLFLRGVDVPEARLRAAFIGELDLYRQFIHKVAGTSDPIDAIAPLVKAMTCSRSAGSRARRKRSRATYDVMRAEGTLAPDVDLVTGRVGGFRQFDERLVSTTLSLIIAEETPDDDSIHELATDGLLHLDHPDKPERPDEDFAEEFAENLLYYNSRAVRSVATEVPLALLIRVRKMLVDLHTFDHLLAPVDQPPEPLDVMTPLLAVLFLQRIEAKRTGRDVSYDDLLALRLEDETPGHGTFSGN